MPALTRNLQLKSSWGRSSSSQLPDDAAILAILIPAETSIGNGFGADVLEAAQNRVLLWNLKWLPQNLDFHQTFVRTKHLRRPILLGRRIRRLRSRLL